ncbi:MAG: cation:proton antiporter [Acidobacteria bacterium]|nr:cation:proton antiporter [Acidobacteriota bacterium]
MTAVTLLLWAVGVMLGVAAVGAIYRIAVGPSLLDRVLAVDVLLGMVAAALAVQMAVTRNLDNLILLVALSVIGFVGSVTVARFVAERRG